MVYNIIITIGRTVEKPCVLILASCSGGKMANVNMKDILGNTE